mmetsp:Transcript_16183/g.25253  ORF Transcript_16183/g.25253 Transcript_16183/m.25253 type:complete len:83 (-) Transcript_16183:902-1150(-)
MIANTSTSSDSVSRRYVIYQEKAVYVAPPPCLNINMSIHHLCSCNEECIKCCGRNMNENLNHHQVCEKSGSRFSKNAVIPSF